MRGEVCVGFGFVLSAASLALLIVAHVGQIDTSHVPNKVPSSIRLDTPKLWRSRS
ncbi:hypothetical protein HDZ31DRAFT_69346 [Schizophyllum fasciatum]